jgi:protein-tyrosine phosphatase
VELAAELDAPAGLPTVRVPALDLVVPSPVWLLRAAGAIERQRVRYGSVLVFCALGYSRSAAAAATWLLITDRARSADEALEIVRRARPQVVLPAALREAVAAAGRDADLRELGASREG